MGAPSAPRRAATHAYLCVHSNIEVFSLVVVDRKKRQSYLAYMIYEIIKQITGPPFVVTEVRMIFRKAHIYSICNQAASLPRPEGMAVIVGAAQSWPEGVALGVGAAQSWPEGVTPDVEAAKIWSEGAALREGVAQPWRASVALGVGVVQLWPEGVPIGEGGLKVL